MSISPAAWLARLIPRRSPPFLMALAICVGAMASAIVLRGLLLGWQNSSGVSATQFPALIVATLYAGQRWGWASLAAAVALGVSANAPVFVAVPQDAVTLMFAISGAITVLVAAAARENFLRLADAQAALDTSEERLLMAQEAGDVGLWSWDMVTGEGVWSASIYRNLGIAPGTPPSIQTQMERIHPDDREMVRANNRSSLKTGHLKSIEYRVIWPDGQVRWLLVRGEMIGDGTGRVIRSVGVNIDVTERHKADDQVRESEARFRALADSAPVLLWVSRADGKREFVNQAYVNYLGEPYEGAIDFDWRKRLHPADIDRILQEQYAGESSRRQFNLEARYRRADDEWRWIRSISQPRFASNGEFNGFIGIGFDVTDTKQAEADLQRINELLAERVEEALAGREQAETALRHAQKLEAVGQLTGGVAHDFNNLLTVIIGALDLMQRHPDDLRRRERMTEAALEAAKRGERLTHQLLAFSRRQALNPQIVQVDELLAQSEPLLRRAVGEAVTLTMLPAAPDATALIDLSQFEAALMNLVVNARDAVSQGGAIRVETSECSLAEGELPETPAGDYICLSVHDTGIGMSPEVMARVFEPFFTTKEVGKGTGLGLSQVYGFVHQSKGGVALDSAPGQGASVRLYLPRIRVDADLAEARPTEVPAALIREHALRVLLVEDDLAVGAMVAALLEDLGHQVVHTDGVPPALDVLTSDVPLDLMLTDLIMPGDKTGVDLAREALQLRPDLPIILSSGYTGETLGPAEAAPWPLLTKPYSAEDLARMIDQVIHRSAGSV